MPKLRNDLESLKDLSMVDYTLEGPRWGSGTLGTSGGVVTWAIDATIPASFVAIVQTAFADWSQYGDISFQQVSTTTGANIAFDDSYIDGPSNVVGNTNYAFTGSSMNAADITFDSGEIGRRREIKSSAATASAF